MQVDTKAKFQQALGAIKNKEFPEAVKLLREVIAEAPEFAPAHSQLGQILAAAGKKQDAEKSLRRAVELAPNEVGSWRGLALFYRRQREYARARQAQEKAVALAPDNLDLLLELLKLRRATKDHEATLKTAEQILTSHPDNQIAALIRAETLDVTGREKESLEQYALLVHSASIPDKALERWVQLMMKFERTEEVVHWLNARVADNPQVFLLRLLLAGCYVHLSLYDKALENLEVALSIKPDNVRAIHDMGVTLRFLGRIDESLQWFARVLEIDPFHATALRVFGTECKYEYGDLPFRRLMRGAARMSDYSPTGRVQMHYALGKCFDDVGDYATAFEHFAEGGKLHLRQSQHDANEAGIKKYFKFAQTNLTDKVLRTPDEVGCPSNKPIFVLGMPRSGTSLVEQVLASSPGVFGAGELKLVSRVIEGIRIENKVKLDLRLRAPLFPGDTIASYAERGQRYVDIAEALSPQDAKRIVDKMPGNYMWVGLIHLILPNAPIIHTRRHPVETCLSAYRIFFPDGQFWSFDLQEMGKAYRAYLDLMQHWRETLPEGRMLEVRYEDVVNDFESQARRLIDYCDLEWDDACLNFHETDRAVRTASAAQVRKPVYKTSIGRWRKYEPYLKPLLDELGSVVDEYEEELAQSSPAGSDRS